MSCLRLFRSVLPMVAVLASASALAGDLPVLTGIYPAGANVAGGNSVLLTGSNFPPTTFVTFDGVAASILRLDANNVYVTAPAHAAGTVAVVLYDNTRSTSGAPTLPFTYSEDFDAGRDFSAVQNPVGAWTYGVAPLPGQPISVDATTGIDGCLDTWSGASFFPIIGHNRTATTCNQYTWSWPPGMIGLHPGNTAENGVVRWTAPTAGRYHVEGQFLCIDNSVGCTIDVRILHNLGTVLFQRAMTASFAPEPFSLDVNLSQGDTIDFNQGNGGNGLPYDQVVLDARIRASDIFRDGFEEPN